MELLRKLSKIWQGINYPFLIHPDRELMFDDVLSQKSIDLSNVKKGSVIALIGDFNPSSILTLLRLFDYGFIVVPLTKETKDQHEYFYENALVDYVIQDNKITKRDQKNSNKLLEKLRKKENPGLILFSTGTTGNPKAILHDATLFLQRFATPRPTLKTLSFLLFDHIGGLNTLFHTLFNKGTIIALKNRTVDEVLKACSDYEVEVLPTTPTFLRMMLISGNIPLKVPDTLKIITYGTELMDQPTLSMLSKLLPKVDFRQTFGMSELGIVRVKSEARDSLYMKIGGEGIETKIVENILFIKSNTRMMGYLNAKSPFDENGWYNTRDIVEYKRGFYKIKGRIGDLINVGGLKFMASDVEKVVLKDKNILFAKVYSKPNPLTGQHVEMLIQPKNYKIFDLKKFKNVLRKKLQPHMYPKRITIDDVEIGHRYKKA